MDDAEAAMMRVLYDEHGSALWRYALHLTGDPARAEDVVQERRTRSIRRWTVYCSGRRCGNCRTNTGR
jgi:RNA polymerase sigma-70 factor (ECF subfamily)